MKKYLIFLVLIFIGCTQNLEGPYLVKEVIDGDTIRLETGTKVRLLGINTPEISSKDCYALEAKNFLKNLVENEEIHLEYDFEDRDKYGRSLRYVYFKGQNVNLILVEEGYAKKYFLSNEDLKYRKKISLLEEGAKIKKKGLWNCYKYSKGFTEIVKKDKFQIKDFLILGLVLMGGVFLFNKQFQKINK